MQKPRNELEIDDAWQRDVFDRLLAPILQKHAYRNQVVFLDIASSIASLLKLRAHVDIVAQLPQGGTMSIEVKVPSDGSNCGIVIDFVQSLGVVGIVADLERIAGC